MWESCCCDSFEGFANGSLKDSLQVPLRASFRVLRVACGVCREGTFAVLNAGWSPLPPHFYPNMTCETKIGALVIYIGFLSTFGYDYVGTSRGMFSYLIHSRLSISLPTGMPWSRTD